MPITFKVATHEAEAVARLQECSADGVLKAVWKSKDKSCQELLQSSFEPSPFVPHSSGFVWSVVEAYNRHHNLIIRPDDLWIAILAQFNLYVNAHSEELRNSFVSFDGKKGLTIDTEETRYTMDYGAIAAKFGTMLKDNIVDPSLHDWVLPSFSTSTPKDMVICSVMMMSTLKAFFGYTAMTRCGIPSITLLGEKEDYEAILGKLDKLDEFGVEPATFARLLRPVLGEFISAFDAAKGNETFNSAFWERICHYQAMSGSPKIGGWISAFCVWNKDGRWQGPRLNEIEAREESANTPTNPSDRLHSFFESSRLHFVFRGLRYPVITTYQIPKGVCEVDVKLIEADGTKFDCMMVSGHVGYAVHASSDEKRDSLQPSAEWFMFVKGDGAIATGRG